MKKSLVLCGLLLISISAYGVIHSQLLEESDIQFQKINNSEGPAMGSALLYEGGWASYNRWQCFPLYEANLECATYDEGTLVPSIRVETGDHTYLFDTHVEDRLSCNDTLLRWKELAGAGNEICIFAAHMPDVDLDADQGKQQSLWYIHSVKLDHGYWDLFSESTEYQ